MWGQVLRELRGLYPAHACAEFLQAFPLFDFREDEIPQVGGGVLDGSLSAF